MVFSKSLDKKCHVMLNEYSKSNGRAGALKVCWKHLASAD